MKYYKWAAIALLSIVLADNVYRAATQSITYDEALTYRRFVRWDWPSLFTRFDANHHVFFTILAKLSVGVFGPSELSMRLPTLLGSLLYFVVVYRLSRHIFGLTFAFLVSVCLLTLNPLILDFLSAARGYGLALAFSLWAFNELLGYLGRTPPSGPNAASDAFLVRASIAVALSIASNLTFVIINAAFCALFALAVLFSTRAPQSRRIGSRGVRLFSFLFLPGFLLGLALLLGPLSRASRSHFYAGTPELSQTARSLLNYSLGHHPVSWWFDTRSAAFEQFVTVCASIVVPMVLALIAWACIATAARCVRARAVWRLAPAEQTALLAGGSVLLTLGALVANRYLLGVRYPEDRTALFFIPYFGLAWLGSAVLAGRTGGLAKGAYYLSLTLLVGLAVQYAVQFPGRHYALWWYDASTKEIVQRIVQEEKEGGNEPVLVGITWMFRQSINFYRVTDGLDWLRMADVRDNPAGCRYYVLIGSDRDLIDRLGLEVLVEGDPPGPCLAVPDEQKNR